MYNKLEMEYLYEETILELILENLDLLKDDIIWDNDIITESSIDILMESTNPITNFINSANDFTKYINENTDKINECIKSKKVITLKNGFEPTIDNGINKSIDLFKKYQGEIDNIKKSNVSTIEINKSKLDNQIQKNFNVHIKDINVNSEFIKTAIKEINKNTQLLDQFKKKYNLIKDKDIKNIKKNVAKTLKNRQILIVVLVLFTPLIIPIIYYLITEKQEKYRNAKMEKHYVRAIVDNLSTISRSTSKYFKQSMNIYKRAIREYIE